MKIYSSIKDPDVADVAAAAITSSGVENYTDIPDNIPVHIHAPSGTPDLSAAAVHVFPDGFDDPEVQIVDFETGEDHFVAFGGDVRCAALFTQNWMGIAGTLYAGVLEAASGCNRLLVVPKAEVGVVLECGHSLEFGTLIAEVVYTEHDMVFAEEEFVGVTCSDPEGVFHPSMVGRHGLDTDTLHERYLSGLPWRAE